MKKRIICTMCLIMILLTLTGCESDSIPEIKAVYVDTGLEYPEIKKFVKTFENVTILRPKMSFVDVIKKYGYPMISKEVSECVQEIIKEIINNNGIY